MKYKDINKGSKAVLSILVKQLLDIINSNKVDSCKIAEIREHLALWVRSNDLHPEEVKTLIPDELGIVKFNMEENDKDKKD